jgi:hypothetical protein
MGKKCIKLEKCPFFLDKMANKPGTAELFKKRFCLGDNTDCARWILFQALGPVEALESLFPNQKEKALKLIEEEKNKGR